MSVFGELQLTQIPLKFKLLVATQKLKLWKLNNLWLSYYFSFEDNCCDVLRLKSPCILLNKNINFNKNKMKSKTENPTHSFRDENCALAHKESQNKRKSLMSRSMQKVHFLYCLFCSKKNFFKICILSQTIVY